jgi:hypothetical protein
MSEPIRVFVQGSGVSVPPGSTLLEAVRASDPAAAAAIVAGFVMRLVSGKTTLGSAPSDD